MKLQQLRYIWEVNRQGLNVSEAAHALFTSQPGVSKQIRALEDELGVQIFERRGKQLVAVTPAGKQILEASGQVLNRVKGIKALADDLRDEGKGALSIATTHTQCRYVLPQVIQRFRSRYPNVSLHMHQGTPLQIAKAAADGTADFAIATEALELFGELTMLPCYRWNRAVIVPKGHPLASVKRLSIKRLSEYPLVTYNFGFTGRSKLDDAFEREGYKADVVFTAADADVIKTYVRLELGVGIVARMAIEKGVDDDLVAIDASHLFEPSVTKIAFRHGTHLRGYMAGFIEMFAPHIDARTLQQRLMDESKADLEASYSGVALPDL
ncbi:MAG: HTH-type transcriptional regulator CysB [Gammaproteobacteria bacterium]|nr:HTH-type transcriptional regulator CysB [Gammaproteobacteria bacterium]